MLDVTAGQGLRFQLINAATIRFFRLILTDEAGTKIPLIRVGGQGGLLDEARKEGNVQPVPAGTFDFKYTDGEILLDPGDRPDVVITIPATATARCSRCGRRTFSAPASHRHSGLTFQPSRLLTSTSSPARGSYSLNAGDDVRDVGWRARRSRSARRRRT